MATYKLVFESSFLLILIPSYAQGLFGSVLTEGRQTQDAGGWSDLQNGSYWRSSAGATSPLVPLQWDRAGFRWAKLQLSSPGKRDLLICEGQGQLIPAEPAGRLGTCFLGAGRIQETMEQSVVIISAAGGVWFRLKFQVNWISLLKSLIRQAQCLASCWIIY